MTDIKIENGDIVLNPNSSAVTVSGISGAVQQAQLAVKIPRTSFIYDRSMGAFEPGFNTSEDGAEGKIEARINECIINSDVYVKVLYLALNGSDEVLLGLEVSDGKESVFTEVVLNG